MPLGAILFRTFLLYILILVIYRMMGKREIGQLSVIDLVVSIMIAELAVVAIEDPTSDLLESILPMLLLLVIQIGMAFLALKSEKVRELVDGKPSVLIRHGRIDEPEMRKQRYNFDDLLVQLREKNVVRLDDVAFAILEPSGHLSVVKESGEKAARGEEDIIYPLPLIMDGEIEEEHLQQLGESKAWLKKRLQRLGYSSIEAISYCAIHKDHSLYIDLNDTD